MFFMTAIAIPFELLSMNPFNFRDNHATASMMYLPCSNPMGPAINPRPSFELAHSSSWTSLKERICSVTKKNPTYNHFRCRSTIRWGWRPRRRASSPSSSCSSSFTPWCESHRLFPLPAEPVGDVSHALCAWRLRCLPPLLCLATTVRWRAPAEPYIAHVGC